MLIKIKGKFGVPEIVFGMLLAAVLFSFGMIFESSRHQPSNSQPRDGAENGSAQEGQIRWTDIALVALNFFLVCSTLMLWKANNRSAKIAERALTGLERPRILAFGPNFAVRDEKMTAQIGLINYGRDPGRVTNITVKFFKEEPPIPADFSGAESKNDALWMMPIPYIGDFRQARQGQFYKGDAEAKFFAIRIFYEWDFGKHEHAAAWTIQTTPGALIESVGGKAYNYDN